MMKALPEVFNVGVKNGIKQTNQSKFDGARKI